LKWWISASMSSFISSRDGGDTLKLSSITGPGLAFSHFTHWAMIGWTGASRRCAPGSGRSSRH
jgi:hypothetical protein